MPDFANIVPLAPGWGAFLEPADGEDDDDLEGFVVPIAAVGLQGGDWIAAVFDEQGKLVPLNVVCERKAAKLHSIMGPTIDLEDDDD
jgi:hypothetical protein